MSYPTSRRYPRTLSQAWPRDYANPIERHPAAGRFAAWAIVLVGFAAFGVVLACWLSGG